MVPSGAGGETVGAAGINERAPAVRVTLLKVLFQKSSGSSIGRHFGGLGGPAAGPQACYSAGGILRGGGPFLYSRSPRSSSAVATSNDPLCGQSEARVNDTIGRAEQELERITNKAEAAIYHRRWLGTTGALALLARNNQALSHYYRSLRREWRRRVAD